MTLKECYLILGLTQSASLDEVKRTYRRRAFELHPDLNPHLTGANQQFQKLNEAYVILTKLLSVREAREDKQRPSEQTTHASSASSASSANSTASSSKNAQTGKSEEKTASSATSGTSQKTAERPADHQSTHSEQASHKAGDTGSSQRPSGAEHTSEKSSETGTSSGGAGGNASAENAASRAGSDHTRSSDGRSREQDMGAAVYAEQQEVLQDILNDPFARRVFEDIYSEIRKKSPQGEESTSFFRRPSSPQEAPKVAQKTAQPPHSANSPKVSKPAPPSLAGGGSRSSLDFSKGIGAMLKGWLRSQIDEEQTFELPARRLIPGARIRLQIRRGFSDEITTLDVTLPPDFKPDKPIRLRGMGKKLGRWQGDLYLRFSPKV